MVIGLDCRRHGGFDPRIFAAILLARQMRRDAKSGVGLVMSQLSISANCGNCAYGPIDRDLAAAACLGAIKEAGGATPGFSA